jgi:tetratricopeptide (TPR) repeat protein
LKLNLKANQLAQAEVDAQQLEAGAPDQTRRVEVLTRLGEFYAMAGHDELAEKWFSRALGVSPDDVGLKLSLARVLLRLGKDLQAAEFLQVALRGGNGRPDTQQERDVWDEARLSLGRIMASSARDPRLSLSFLREIGSRSRWAVEARTLEASLAGEIGDVSSRRSAWLRLLEALELGWIPRRGLQPLLLRIEREERSRGQDDIADFAMKLLREMAGESLSPGQASGGSQGTTGQSGPGPFG